MSEQQKPTRLESYAIVIYLILMAPFAGISLGLAIWFAILIVTNALQRAGWVVR